MGFIEYISKLVVSNGTQHKINDKDKAILAIAEEIINGGGGGGGIIPNIKHIYIEDTEIAPNQYENIIITTSPSKRVIFKDENNQVIGLFAPTLGNQNTVSGHFTIYDEFFINMSVDTMTKNDGLPNDQIVSGRINNPDGSYISFIITTQSN